MNKLIDRSTELRMRRRFRSKRRQVEGMGAQAEEHIEKHFFERLSRLVQVRSFVVSWLVLVILLGGIVGLQLRLLTR